MQERALFSTADKAASTARAFSALPLYVEARPVTVRGQRIGYEGWYRDRNDIMQPVMEHEV